MRNKVLLGLTTTTHSDWRKKIRDIRKFDLREIALFVTGVGKFEREEIYRKLERSQIEKIPHVHARDDFDELEIDYLVERFGVEFFNIHAMESCKHFLSMKKHLDKIYIENSPMMSKENFEFYIEHTAGVCIDFSHWESFKRKFPHKKYGDFIHVLKTHKIGCCHVSGVKIEPFAVDHNKKFSVHSIDDLYELDYMKKYVKYLPRYVSLELENSFEQQLQAKKYLEKIIREHKE